MKNDAAHPIYEGSNVYQFGLTKREAFAMSALQGLLSNGNYNQASKKAVRYADNLLKELEQTNE